jgi:AAA family ATP:ADP antiporter
MTTDPPVPIVRPSTADRMLRVFGDVRPGEGGTVLLLFVNLFLLLLGYYVLKTVRDTLILTDPSGGAEAKAYSSAGQALLLIAFVPLYSRLAARVDRVKLIFGMLAFYIVSIELFYAAIRGGVPYAVIGFFIWAGIFNLTSIALFWSYANDLYRQGAGERLFAIIAIGGTVGAALGSKVAAWLFAAGLRAATMLHVAVAILLVDALLYWMVNQREARKRREQAAVSREPVPAGDGFALVLSSPYLRLFALLLIVLNIVNTNGNYILEKTLLGLADAAAIAAGAVDKQAFADQYVGTFVGNFGFYQNLLVVLLQSLLVSRIVKYFGIRGVLLTLPLVALGTYGLAAVGIGFTYFRVLQLGKMLENATDYSVMNTGKQMLWLPTSRNEKYQAKQAIDGFFVRLGDLLSAGLVFVFTALTLGPIGVAWANVVLIGLWIVVVGWLVREYRAGAAARSAAADAA